MIRPLRQRHRVTICAIGVILPIAFAAGISARRPIPVVASVPPELGGTAKEFGKVVWSKADLWPEQRIITLLRRDAAGEVAVELMFRDLVKPDVLVYWAPETRARPSSSSSLSTSHATQNNTLPFDARLLGALANRAALHIPSDVRGEVGRFVLYSLADHEIIAASRAFTLRQAN